MDLSSRIRKLNRDPESRGDYVLYWMQACVRSNYNYALEFAVSEANRNNLPLVTVFCVDTSFPEANERHFSFLLEGLKEAKEALSERGVRLITINENCIEAIPRLAERACIVITDMGYLRIQRSWRRDVAKKVGTAMFEVETETVVPVEAAKNKECYSAAVLRPSIQNQLGYYLIHADENSLRQTRSCDIEAEEFRVDDVDEALLVLDIDRSVGPAGGGLTGGCVEAEKRLENFISEKLDRYEEVQRDPVCIGASYLSPYLHFGHISPVKIALDVLRAGGPGVDKFLEQLIVRRELAVNFVYYNPYYDSYEALPEWARVSLEQHSTDEREYFYSLDELEKAETHDPYWNAAQKQMVKTGYMHNYMRMYWGKKIIEWSGRPEDAFKAALYLNNKYLLDGRDPNGFAGVAWCFGKHDRPWQERGIFGKIRYMNAAGLKRKFDIEEYVRKING